LGQEDDPKFDWDEANLGHIARHDVTPEEVESALRNDPLDLGYEHMGGEDRWTILGHTDQLRVLVIVFTVRGEAFRAVTARDVPRKRRLQYLRMRRPVS